ncbi:tyrosinase family protein [Hymenobacter cellulosilyticus]|uniref:Tyrosinase family protein n=1 Tax=Hymenobacter cellulosilyticus TaxID=2932248 RepID=A0A8T9Q7K7_9BACT|nr:tyrosinase family protein [Hymenobacter cellulosilyticus]UOQ72028.1 tyrosinase family protein [Hymenobacter cellulosilyticus]
MNSPSAIRTRYSVTELQKEYDAGNTKPLDDLIRAWAGIKTLPADDLKSFFNLGGYHGEPFRGEGATNGAYWGGYCNHGNVLFPTWHRVYCLKIEEALRSIPGCEDVTLPYWDETDSYTLSTGIPKVLTAETYPLDGVVIPNPLRSFTLPVAIVDAVQTDNQNNPDDPNYSKPIGYQTVRYPLSGLVGTPQDQAATTAHNAQYPDTEKNIGLLDSNVVQWMKHTFYNGTDNPIGILAEFQQCLQAPNYTVFSNTTSAQEWNKDKPAAEQVMPLEQPHNDIHLAVGGFDVPGTDLSLIQDANGDMGENDTAALDPIFYFHHCNIDRVFWLWQQQHQATDQLEIIASYPGTSSSDAQGPTPGIAPDTQLTLDTALNPFKHGLDNDGPLYTSHDCINIETQLGYTYTVGSLAEVPVTAQATPAVAAPAPDAKVLHVSQVNKAPIKGSFIIAAFAEKDGKKELIGYKSVLSRWDSGSCINCQTHLEVKAAFPLTTLREEEKTLDNITVELITRAGSRPVAARAEVNPSQAKTVQAVKSKMQVEIR